MVANNPRLKIPPPLAPKGSVNDRSTERLVPNGAVLCLPRIVDGWIEVQVWSANGRPAQVCVFSPSTALTFASALSEAAEKLTEAAHG